MRAVRGTPVGEPPGPGAARVLDDLVERLADLRTWARFSLRDLLAGVEALRRGRGVPEERGVRPSYGAVQALFQKDRKRLNEELLLDAVRVLLGRQGRSGAWLEEQVTSWRRTYRLVIKEPIPEVRGVEFRLGPLRTPCRILEGDGERAIEERNVRVRVDPVDVALPEELTRWRTQLAAEQSRRWQRGEEYVWNGPRYAVTDLTIARVGLTEAPEVTLRLKHSDYYTFLTVQQLDRQLRDGATLRSLYLDGKDPREVPDFMRSSFGLNVALVTADNWLVVSRRSTRVGVGKGSWNASANEGLHRHLDAETGGPPDLFRAAERGVREELRVDADQYELRLLAFAVVTSLSHWCALFLARMDTMSRQDFEDNIGRGIPDAWEHPEFDYVRFEPGSLFDYLVRKDRRNAWAPAAPVLFYLSLVNSYGRRAVDEAAGRMLSGVR